MMIFGEDDDGEGAARPVRRRAAADLPATRSCSPGKIARCVRQVLEMIDAPTDPVPAEMLAERGLPGLGEALHGIHMPARDVDWPGPGSGWSGRGAGRAAGARATQGGRAERPAPSCPPVPGGLLDEFDAQLPFTLTDGSSDREVITRDLAPSSR